MASMPSKSDLIQTGIAKGTFRSALASMWDCLTGLLGQDGTQATALATLGAPFAASIYKAGAYTVAPADRGKCVRCSGTFTLAFTPAPTLGDGFVFMVMNEGSGTITLDPDLSEKIDAVTTLTLAAGRSVIVFCDGVKFETFGRGGVESFNARAGAVTLTGADLLLPFDAIGSYCFAALVSGAQSLTAGNTYSGSSLRATGTSWNADGAGSTHPTATGATLSGTWRCLGTLTVTSTYVASLFQRIA